MLALNSPSNTLKVRLKTCSLPNSNLNFFVHLEADFHVNQVKLIVACKENAVDNWSVREAML